jgi:hypothetical protein
MKIPRSQQPGLLAQKLRAREQQALDLVLATPGIGAADVAQAMAIQTITAGNYLNVLTIAGLVHCRGYGRWAGWWPGQAPPAAVQMSRTPLGPNSVWSMA